MSEQFFTIGHSTRSLEDFAALLRDSQVALVVDVRSIPRSRTNPQFNQDTLPASLAERQVGYVHLATLGGRRGRQRGVEPSVNGFWTVASFHNYADYALGPAFADGLAELRRLGERRRLAIMCAEAVWWRCHRRIIADHLIAAGEEVFHILGQGHVEAARLTPAARLSARVVTYPANAELTAAAPSSADQPSAK